ncbi:MAG: YggS family pyridoxal phosphate-dependent enzyme [Candidatus Omnitrophica bacterium]|nr:YggS family pyridoxal phosphate-dependent enzyme [Candidatus Omnitrophota bacterium]
MEAELRRGGVIDANLEQIRQRIAAAARSKGRDPAGVRLIGVTKGVPVERIREAIACGVREIGENRVQEAQQKQPAIGREVRWHLIGHLQRNKVRAAVELFDVVHSVDSLELVEALGRAVGLRPAQPERGLELLVQVNVSGEAAKHGCKPDEARVLAAAILKSKNLKLSGFMTMAPFADDPESARPVFRQLRRLRDGIDPSLDLSMGMSQDLEVAVEEGATMVRIGTAIFQ